MVTLNPIRLKDLSLRGKLIYKAAQNPDFKLENPELNAIAAFAVSKIESKKPASPELKFKLSDIHQLYSEYYGFSNWPQLKQYVIDQDCFYRKWASVFVFKWFKTYKHAYQYQKNNGGYLLQFWGDYVICGKEYINRLGLLHFEENWRAVQYNSVEPFDQSAWAEIKQQAVTNYLIINK